MIRCFQASCDACLEMENVIGKMLYAVEKACGQMYIFMHTKNMFAETSYPYCFFLVGYESILSIVILIIFGK